MNTEATYTTSYNAACEKLAEALEHGYDSVISGPYPKMNIWDYPYSVQRRSTATVHKHTIAFDPIIAAPEVAAIVRREA